MIDDPAKINAKGVEPKPCALSTVVPLVVLVAKECFAHAQAAGQIVNSSKAMRVRTASLMRDQNICILLLQALVIDWKNAAPMLER